MNDIPVKGQFTVAFYVLPHLASFKSLAILPLLTLSGRNIYYIVVNSCPEFTVPLKHNV